MLSLPGALLFVAFLAVSAFYIVMMLRRDDSDDDDGVTPP